MTPEQRKARILAAMQGLPRPSTRGEFVHWNVWASWNVLKSATRRFVSAWKDLMDHEIWNFFWGPRNLGRGHP